MKRARHSGIGAQRHRDARIVQALHVGRKVLPAQFAFGGASPPVAAWAQRGARGRFQQRQRALRRRRAAFEFVDCERGDVGRALRLHQSDQLRIHVRIADPVRQHVHARGRRESSRRQASRCE